MTITDDILPFRAHGDGNTMTLDIYSKNKEYHNIYLRYATRIQDCKDLQIPQI